MVRPARHTGFTLLELLVVIGIIAVLVALLLPTLSRARRLAQRSACLNVLRQLACANFHYLGSTGGRFHAPVKYGYDMSPSPAWQPVWTPPPVTPSPPLDRVYPWYSLAPYREALDLPQKADKSRVPAGMVCPLARLALDGANLSGCVIARSYGYNSTGLGHKDNPPTYFIAMRPGQIRSAATKLMFADATDWSISESGSHKYDLYGEDHGPPNVPLAGLPVRTGITAYRHDDGANIAYWDGHAQWLHKSEIVRNRRLWQTKDQ